MFKKSVNVSIIFFISILVQLLSQIVVTRIFGSELDLSIFLAAVTLPTIFVTVIYGTLSDAFLPLYSKYRNENGHKGDNYLFSSIFYLTILSSSVGVVLFLLSPVISRLLYSSQEASFINAVSFQMQFMWLGIPLATIATLLGSSYYAQKKFLFFPLVQLLGNIINITLIVTLYPYLGVWSMIVAFVVNLLGQVLLLLPWKTLKFTKNNFPVKPLIIAWLPLIISVFALRSDSLLIRSFSSEMSENYIVYLNLITKILSLATGVATIGIQVILLPHLVEYLDNKDHTKAVKLINKSKLYALILSGIIIAGIIVLGPPLIKLIFLGGKFTERDIDATISLLPWFLLPALGWGINGVFFQPLLALKKQIHLAVINTSGIIFGWTTAMIISDIYDPLWGISTGLIVHLFTGIIGSELIWQFEKRKLRSKTQQL